MTFPVVTQAHRQTYTHTHRAVFLCLHVCSFLDLSLFPTIKSSSVWIKQWHKGVEDDDAVAHTTPSPPTDCSPPPFPNLCSLDYYPTFLSLMCFPSHLHLSLISLPFLARFFNQCICLHISSFHFLNKESLLLLLLRILISFCWYSFLCPLLSLCATAGSQKMADTFCKLVYSFFCYPPVLCFFAQPGVRFGLTWLLTAITKLSWSYTILPCRWKHRWPLFSTLPPLSQ